LSPAGLALKFIRGRLFIAYLHLIELLYLIYK
jgi:hypothetical protein